MTTPALHADLAPVRAPRTELWGVLASVGGVNLLGWGVLLVVVAPQDLHLADGRIYGVGLGVTAFLLGARHALDADHVALIDGATRRLVAAGHSGVATGFWFALGHSSVVFGLCAAIALGLRTLPDGVHADALATVGSVAAVGFLVWIGTANVHRSMTLLRRQSVTHGPRGPLGRLAGRALSGVTAPQQLYPMGLVMGLGFDTATQVALLLMAGGSAAALPWYAILVLPVLFAAGMLAVDTLDSGLMARAWRGADGTTRWAFGYDLTISLVCALASFVVAGHLVAQVAGITSPR